MPFELIVDRTSNVSAVFGFDTEHREPQFVAYAKSAKLHVPSSPFIMEGILQTLSCYADELCIKVDDKRLDDLGQPTIYLRYSPVGTREYCLLMFAIADLGYESFRAEGKFRVAWERAVLATKWPQG